MKRNLFIIFLLVIGSLYLYFRLWNLDQNLEFTYDQGLHLLESFQMVQSRHLRLLGPAVTSITYQNRQFFIGPYYYYLLALLGIITRWNPLSITQVIIILDLIFFLAFIIFLFIKFGFLPAVVSAVTISFSGYLIYHQRFFWNPHFLLPLSYIEIYFYDRYLQNKKIIDLYLCCLIFGVAFSFHYTALFWIIFLIYPIFKNIHSLKLPHFLVMILMFVVGNLPFFISESRHSFYNLRTILLALFVNDRSSGLTSHYFIFPLLVFVIYFLIIISRKLNFPFYLIIFLFLFFKPQPSLDIVAGWQYPQMQQVKNIILQNCPVSYNIASTMTGDTRAYNLRFLLTTTSCPPLSEISYPDAATVYLVAPPSRPPQTENVWEISSFRPFTVKSMVKLNNQVNLYRLDKNYGPDSKDTNI
jgi:hypothetical protein